MDDALTNKEELQVYNLVCEQRAIKLNKDGKNIEESRQQACRFFTDETKSSKRSDLYVETAQEHLFTHRVYSKSELRLGSMWLSDDFEKEQSGRHWGSFRALSFYQSCKPLTGSSLKKDCL